jgi:hypothetical protein
MMYNDLMADHDSVEFSQRSMFRTHCRSALLSHA